MYDEPDDVLQSIRNLRRIQDGVRREDYEGIPDHYHPLKSWKTPTMIDDELSMRIDHLLYRYAELTGERFDTEEYRGERLPVMAFTWEKAVEQ